MIKKPLSFSGYKRFITCPKFYYYNDVLGEKVESMSSALVFGSAIDNALNDMLVNRDLLAAKNIAKRYIIDTQIDMYYLADYDADFSQDELESYVTKNHSSSGIDTENIMQELLTNQNSLSSNERKLMSHICKDTLKHKANVILDSYFVKVLPMIKSVESIQKEIVLKDGSKRGIIDTILITNDNKRVIFDNKTSSRPYEKDAVLKSPQLALYAHLVGADYAGFIVMNKQITKNRTKICSKCGNDGSGTKFRTCNNITGKKKCGSKWNETIDPYSYIQIFIDKMPQINKDIIVEAMDETISCINNGVFPRNLNNCFSMYGQKCVYINNCWKQKEKK